MDASGDWFNIEIHEVKEVMKKKTKNCVISTVMTIIKPNLVKLNKQNVIWLQRLNILITGQKLRIAGMTHQNCMAF